MQIKMVTDLVAELEQKMLQLGRDTYESSDQLLSSVNRDFWQGRGADEFKQRAREVCNKLHLFAEEITKLGFALSLEKEEWIRVDQEGINRLKKNVIKPSPVKEVPYDKQWNDTWDYFEDRHYDKKYALYEKWWQSQSLEDRKKYLQDLQNRMADRYEWPRMLLVVDDLPDSDKGDFKGVNLGKLMIIDVDNMNTDEPWRLIETTFHESRHEYQRDVMANFLNNGQVPNGMTQKQVEEWVYENNHYISGIDNFADYYHQAIETDARKFGDIVMKDVLDDLGNDGIHGSGTSGSW